MPTIILCSIINCPKPKHAKGLCSAHYSYAIRSHDIAPTRVQKKREYHGLSKTKTYVTYKSMIERCYNPKSVSYKYYGAAGVKICQRWLESFEAFYEDMGEKPKGFTIDRIDGYDDYRPGNCRWATWSQQALNKNSKYKKLALFRDEYDNEGDFSHNKKPNKNKYSKNKN